MRTVIIASLTNDQLSYLRNLATEHGITAEFIVESVEGVAEQEDSSSTPSSTPLTSTRLTGEILDAVARQRGINVLDAAKAAVNWNIYTIEEALAHNEVPSSIKELLESYL